MEYYTSIDPSSVSKNFTGLFLTKWEDGMWVLKLFENGKLLDFVDNIDPEEDSIDGIVFRYLSSIENDDHSIELYVDSSITDAFETNLEDFPFEDVSLLSDEDYDDYVLTPQERAEIEAELEEDAEDAFTRFCDN